MNILLVDDSVRQRRAGKRQLEALGHIVTATCEYGEALKLAKANVFDVALIDLLMPAEPTTLGPDARTEFVGREIAVGFPLVLALSKTVPAVAMATDTNHHAHPMSAAVDWFIGQGLTVNGARVLIVHAPMEGDAKNWAQVLADLMAVKD